MAATGMPRLNALRGSVHDRAQEYRANDEQASEQAALDNGGGLAGLTQTRGNNLKSRVMAMNNPQWDDFFQSIRDVSGGAPVKLVGGPSPEGSNQITGLRSPFTNQNPVIDGPYAAPDTGPFGNAAEDHGPYADTGSVNALRGRVSGTAPITVHGNSPMPDPHDLWLAKTRQRIYGGAQS